MKEYNTVTEIIQDDELVNDFEFAERLYTTGLLIEENNYFLDNDLIWQDLI